MRIQKLALVTSGCVLMLALAACGSSGSSGLSKQLLASKTNAICNTYRPKIAAVPQPADLLQNHVSAAKYFDQVVPLYDQALAQFRSFKPADSVKTQWNDLVAKFGALATLLDQIKTKAQNADRSGILLLSQISPLTRQANAAAITLGATDCTKTA